MLRIVPKSSSIIALLGLLSLFLSFSPGVYADDASKPHPYRLASTNIKERVIWGSTAEAPDGLAISFGGQDQDADDGQAHTRLRVNGQWQDIYEELRKANHLQPFYEEEWELIDSQRHTLARARSVFLEGLPDEEMARAIAPDLVQREKHLSADVHVLAAMIMKAAAKDKDLANATRQVDAIQALADEAVESLNSGINAAKLAEFRQVQVAIEQTQDTMSPEPPARALSAIAYEPKTKMFVVFGGDHCDYLTNDTWVFDPAIRKWSLRNPPSAPSPRANHAWRISGDGKLVLTGGYTYFPNTDYMGGQYIDINDGDWTYDVASDTWTGAGKSAPANTRTYRTGPFLPEYFFEGMKPGASEFQAKLRSLPANVWTKTNPPRLPQVNRDWGSAVIDPDRDLILRFSGGHCAHGGSDVIEFHLASNRWELCFPVEFPLGQLYCNTDYPNGFNFNRRPWVSGHTYQNYGVDPVLKKMLFLGHAPWGYIYDPERGDWTARSPLPKAMDYSGSMYTLTTTPTPQGLICWTHPGQVFRFDALASRWNELRIEGEKLPGAEVDNSTVVYDSRRDRLLFMRKGYGDRTKYDGEIFSLDMKSLQVSRLSLVNMKSAEAIPYLCQIRYDPAHDLLLAGATLPSGPDGLRRTPGYDCAANKWVSFKITGDDPSGEKGRNVSLGLMYDAHRNLFWAVDTRSQIFVLRFEPALADERELPRD